MFNFNIKEDKEFYKPMSFEFVRILPNGNYRFDFSETFYKLENLMTNGGNLTFVNQFKD